MLDSREPHWKTLDRRVVHSGRMTLVEHHVELPDGSLSRFEVDESVPYSVASLVIDGGCLLLARQYRYPLGRWIYDLPGGGGRTDEEPIDAARRELEEELGVVVRDLRPLHTFFMNPGRSSWPTHLFISKGGVETGTADASDPAEQVRLARIPIAEFHDLLREGAIIDAPLIVACAMAAACGDLPLVGHGFAEPSF